VAWHDILRLVACAIGAQPAGLAGGRRLGTIGPLGVWCRRVVGISTVSAIRVICAIPAIPAHLVVTAPLIARPCARVPHLVDVTGRDRQQEERRRQEYRHSCRAAAFVGDNLHCGPLYIDGLFIRGGESVALETWGEAPVLSYRLPVEVIENWAVIAVFVQLAARVWVPLTRDEAGVRGPRLVNRVGKRLATASLAMS
jgi:hypothetical protein